MSLTSSNHKRFQNNLHTNSQRVFRQLLPSHDNLFRHIVARGTTG